MNFVRCASYLNNPGTPSAYTEESTAELMREGDLTTLCDVARCRATRRDMPATRSRHARDTARHARDTARHARDTLATYRDMSRHAHDTLATRARHGRDCVWNSLRL